ncbi:cytoglobin-1-like [Protopterus annectens]|uniref:cytoglobin-1-like n=1 Tax=Protopterus annectens TaxID=7888 RepID=UPI001CFB43BF|nr:cytoglobin-1-like [Protopterus annectens]XP_043942362.1 cytoglobin-1-like [Protopterus annectens]
MALAADDIQKAKSVWEKFYVNAEDNGAIVLSRMFKEHPHTVSYFTNFKELQSIAGTASAAKLEGLSEVRNHGKKVLSALNDMVQQVDNMDALKAIIEPLGKKHAVELKVDVKEFEILCGILLDLMAEKCGEDTKTDFKKVTDVVCEQIKSTY